HGRSVNCSGSYRAPHQMQMLGTRFRVDEAEAAAMLQRRDRLARALDLRRIDPGHHDAGLDAAFGEHDAPRIDDQRVAVALAPALVFSRLGCGKNVAAVL